MRLFSVIFALVLFTNTSFAAKYVLKGRILDRNTLESLPYATIEICALSIGTIADHNGAFILTIETMDLLDTIEFSFHGYRKFRCTIESFLTYQANILLEPAVIELDAVVVKPKKYKTVTLGIIDSKPKSYQITNMYNNKISNYLENTKRVEGWGETICFYIYPLGHPESPFRVRIFDYDRINNCPGNDLLNQNVVVQAKEAGWFAVDLSEYNIPFPKDGLFVMMEWINAGDQYLYETEMPVKNEDGNRVMQKRQFYGQVIGSVFKPKMTTWGITLGNEWTVYNLHGKGYINAMINADIIYPVD